MGKQDVDQTRRAILVNGRSIPDQQAQFRQTVTVGTTQPGFQMVHRLAGQMGQIQTAGQHFQPALALVVRKTRGPDRFGAITDRSCSSQTQPVTDDGRLGPIPVQSRQQIKLAFARHRPQPGQDLRRKGQGFDPVHPFAEQGGQRAQRALAAAALLIDLGQHTAQFPGLVTRPAANGPPQATQQFGRAQGDQMRQGGAVRDRQTGHGELHVKTTSRPASRVRVNIPSTALQRYSAARPLSPQ